MIVTVKMPPRCPLDEGRSEEVSTCALRSCEPLACTAGYLRSLAIRRLASDRKYLAHFYMPAELVSCGETPRKLEEFCEVSDWKGKS